MPDAEHNSGRPLIRRHIQARPSGQFSRLCRVRTTIGSKSCKKVAHGAEIVDLRPLPPQAGIETDWLHWGEFTTLRFRPASPIECVLFACRLRVRGDKRILSVQMSENTVVLLCQFASFAGHSSIAEGGAVRGLSHDTSRCGGIDRADVVRRNHKRRPLHLGGAAGIALDVALRFPGLSPRRTQLDARRVALCGANCLHYFRFASLRRMRSIASAQLGTAGPKRIRSRSPCGCLRRCWSAGKAASPSWRDSGLAISVTALPARRRRFACAALKSDSATVGPEKQLANSGRAASRSARKRTHGLTLGNQSLGELAQSRARDKKQSSRCTS